MTCERIRNERQDESVCSASYNYEGYSENTACCYCDGGLDLRSILVEEVAAESESCIDKPGWKSDDLYCSNYTNDKDGYTCEIYGALTDTLSFALTSGNEACCTCGGGYRGSLIGKTFRVGIVPMSEEVYSAYTNSDGTINGSIPEFVQYGAENLGIGLYETDFSINSAIKYPENVTSQINQRCLDDLREGHVDVCVGEYIPEYVQITDAL